MNDLYVNGAPIDYSELPEHMQEGMRLYMERCILPGSFLTAVLENNFMEAVGRADSVNRARLADYATWLYNHAPPMSFGSRENVEKWCNERS